MDRRGTVLGGRYRLDAKIGTGGMSDVYAATDELLTRDVAVKMMRPDLARDTTFLERFRREAQNAARLNQPNIVAVYDTGETPEEDGSVPYIVMERVHGDTLRDIINDQGKMGLTEAAKVMSQVCDALHFSHEAGIIHRDIKPANIMITNTGAVKVMDFGIARALSDSSAAMTQTAAVIGTAQYLSPEQARGKSADSRSDIYAAGCVFYELTTGRPPFEGESPFSVAFQHVQDDPKPPSSVQGLHLSKREALSLDSIVLTAMAKKPDDRYDDANQMSIDLRRLSEDQLPLVAQAYVDDEESNTSVMPAAGAAGLAGAAGAAAGAGAAGAAGGEHAAASNNLPDEYDNADFAGGAGSAAHGYDQGYDDGYGDGDYDDYDDEYYEDEYYDGKSRRPWVPILWTLVVLALLGGGGYVAYTYLNNDEPRTEETVKVAIPDVANLGRADAEKKLREANLEVDVTERSDAEIERGMAIGTEPEPGSSVPSGSRVTLVISSGKEITDVPDLTGLTTDAARQALIDAGLELNPQVREEPSSDTPAGQVVSQSPDQGSQVSKGTKVTITVSSGPEEIRVPVVTGQDLDDARSNLEAAGFVVLVNSVDSMEPENQVLSASSEGERLPEGSEITLTVSKGNQFEMPSLQGKKFNEVYRELQRAGWRGTPEQIKRRNVNTADLGRVDQVAQQSIRAGEPAGRDASITIDVYVFSLLP